MKNKEAVAKSRTKAKNQKVLDSQNSKKEMEDKKQSQRERKALSRKRLRESDYEKVKDDQNQWRAKRRMKLKGETSILQKPRSVDKDAYDRLRSFRESTMCGPVFVCVSCHGKMFKVAVQKFTENVAE